ncbi:MAG: aldehyde:ferredoxin oxidoreductase [Dehalococcoidia bacterium]|nr:aldehyde:ferredoxin oxidoreductase [Dehalococcoidia bacterium]
MNGYAGKFLRVDLTREKLTDEVFDEATLRAYVGGTGIGAKVLYDEVPPGVAWNDPENRVILASGPLGGSTIPGSGSYTVTTKGPLTNGASVSQANGFFGAYLRFCGYDGVIVQGAAKRWVYIHITENGAELKDASHLLGKDTWETDDLIKGELGRKERAMSIACIGPAGENLVRVAAVCNDKGHVAGHNGPGAVMGSKKLKAIAVDRGRFRPTYSDSKRLTEIAKGITTKLRGDGDPAKATFFNFGTLNGVTQQAQPGGWLPVKNYLTQIYDISPDDLERYSGKYIRGNFEPKPNPCWACPCHHCHMMKIPYGPYKGEIVEEQEYEGFVAFGPVTGQTDVAATAVLSNDVDRWGMEVNELGYLMGMAIECYEKGIINREDTDGVELKWGNAPATREMLRKIAFRDGFGNVLAEGVMRASRLIGGEAPNMAVHTMKGNSVRGHDHRVLWVELFDTCTSSTGTIETHRGSPKDQYGMPAEMNFFDPDNVVDFVAKAKSATPFSDSIGTCRFCVGLDTRNHVEAVRAATGWDFTFDEAVGVGLRSVNLLRAFNLRHGIGPELDRPSPRYGSTPVDGVAAGVGIMPHWDGMVRNYYQQMGWDPKTSKPLPETLKNLGLEQVAVDLWG